MNFTPGAMPRDIKALKSEGVLQITWSDGVIQRYGFVFLRGECVCARCVDEITGERILDRATILADLTLEDMQLVGNYALRIYWSDGHNTGLFTWPLLRKLGE
jgi:DUF971 family protein